MRRGNGEVLQGVWEKSLDPPASIALPFVLGHPTMKQVVVEHNHAEPLYTQGEVSPIGYASGWMYENSRS